MSQPANSYTKWYSPAAGILYRAIATANRHRTRGVIEADGADDTGVVGKTGVVIVVIRMVVVVMVVPGRSLA